MLYVVYCTSKNSVHMCRTRIQCRTGTGSTLSHLTAGSPPCRPHLPPPPPPLSFPPPRIPFHAVPNTHTNHSSIVAQLVWRRTSTNHPSVAPAVLAKTTPTVRLLSRCFFSFVAWHGCCVALDENAGNPATPGSFRPGLCQCGASNTGATPRGWHVFPFHSPPSMSWHVSTVVFVLDSCVGSTKHCSSSIVRNPSPRRRSSPT